MKKLFLAATLAFAGFSAVQANEVASNNTNIIAVQDSVSKTAIKLEELPAPVQTSLKNEAYKDWAATGAFLVKDAKAQKEWYQVDVKKGEEVGNLKFDKDGKPVQ
jgi:hypothetical protein